MYCASIALALFAFGYTIRGGTQIYGTVNLTHALLLATILFVGIHLWAAKRLRYRLIWADVVLIGFALAMLANSGTIAGIEKSVRFLGLVLAPYFLARVILVDFVRVKLFLATVLAVATVLGLGVVAFSFLPEPVAILLPYAVTEWNQRLIFLDTNPVQFGMLLMVGAMLYTGLTSSWRRLWMVLGVAVIGALLYDILIVGNRASLVAVFGASLAAVSLALITRKFRNFPILFAVFIAAGILFYSVFAAGLSPTPARGSLGVTCHDDEQARVVICHEGNQARVESPFAVYLTSDSVHKADDYPVVPWRWQMAGPRLDDATTPDDATWADIDGARLHRLHIYIPAEDDLGKFLRVDTSYEKEGEILLAQTTAVGPLAEASSGFRLPRFGIRLPNQERFETLALLFKSSENLTEEEWRLRQATIVNRFDLLEESRDKFAANPLFGAGTAGMANYAHNIFAETAAEMGLMGLALLLAFFALALRNLWKFFVKMDQRNPYFHVITAVVLVVSALFIQKQFSTGLTHHKDLIIFVAIILNLPLLLGMPSREAGGRLRDKLPPRLRFLIPAKGAAPADDAEKRP